MKLALRRATWMLALAMLTVGRRATAAGDDDFFTRLAATVRAHLEAEVAARAPQLVPPVRVEPHWRPQKLGSLDLGAEPLAMAAADLDGDGKGEVYVVTAREVIALSLTGHKLVELGRVAFAGDLALPSPRDLVGTATVDGRSLVASVSTWTKSLRVHWQGKTLVGEPGAAGFMLCPGELEQLVPGRNYFGEGATAHFGARCRSDLVGPTGRPLHVRATLNVAGRLDVSVSECPPGAPCVALAPLSFTGVGVAFELADVDRDGTPEVIISGAGAPGDPDAVKVMTFGGDEKKGVFRKQFNGGVAGIAAVDSDGDGIAEIVAAVRLVGSTRVDLWRLD